MTQSRRILLNLRLSAAHFGSFWRLPEVDAGGLYDFDRYRRLAQHAEQRAIHALFDADSLGITVPSVRHQPPRGYEPLSYLSALAVSTSRIGLIGTFSTTFSEPYNLARGLASLDRLSGGRAGWNIVTTAINAAGYNFGYEELPEHDSRYERAEEFLEVVKALWLSFDTDAAVIDKEHGVYFDPERVHEINHRGEHFTVRGPLNSPRTPQVWPVFSQAGASEPGRAYAARHADVVFSHFPVLEDAVAYRTDLRARAEALGRDPDTLKVFSAASLITGASDADAEDYAARLKALEPERDPLQSVSETVGFDLTRLADGEAIPPLPDHRTSNNHRTQLEHLTRLIERKGLTTIGALRAQLRTQRLWESWVGSPTTLADRLEEWFAAGAVDGFTVGGDLTEQHGTVAILDRVVPELQRRGLFRTEYEGATLRENYGVPSAPPSLAALRGAGDA